jgi:hypothetical protein
MDAINYVTKKASVCESHSKLTYNNKGTRLSQYGITVVKSLMTQAPGLVPNRCLSSRNRIDKGFKSLIFTTLGGRQGRELRHLLQPAWVRPDLAGSQVDDGAKNRSKRESSEDRGGRLLPPRGEV